MVALRTCGVVGVRDVGGERDQRTGRAPPPGVCAELAPMPPCASTIAATIAMPSPAPPESRPRLASTR